MTTQAIQEAIAQRVVRTFSEKHARTSDLIRLARYAALPVAIDPNLLHFIRLNFFPNLPFAAESEILLSKLCAEIGDGLYEIPPEVRTLLLRQLLETEEDRVPRLAALLWEYSAGERWPGNVQLTRAQQLTALDWLAPEQAQAWLDSAEEARRSGALAAGAHEWFVAMRREVERQEAVRRQVEETLAVLGPDLEPSPELAGLIDNLVRALSYDEMDTLLFILGVDTGEFTYRNSSKTKYFRDVVLYFNRQRRIDELIAAAVREKPDNVELAESARGLGGELNTPPTKSQLRDFIAKHFRLNELHGLIFDFYPNLYMGVVKDISTSQLIRELISYADRRAELPNLHAIIARARPEAWNRAFGTETTKHQRDFQKIFISHASADAEIARRLKYDLEEMGWQVRVRSESIPPRGRDLFEEINYALETSEVYLLILTPAAAKSEMVRIETRRAIELEQAGKIMVIPLLWNEGNYPPLWQTYQWVVGYGDYPIMLDELNKRLSDHIVPTRFSGLDTVEKKLAQLTERGLQDLSTGYLESALADFSWAIEIDPANAELYFNRGQAYREKGMFDAALADFNRAIEIKPDQYEWYNSRGAIYYLMGRYAEALADHERVLAIYERVLGPEHPGTAQSLNAIGYLLQAMGELVAARPYFERALAIRERVLGPEHPDTAQSLNNMGYLLQAMGQLVAARPYFERALAIWERVLGPEHPDTANSLNNMGYLLQAMGELAAAQMYYERALAAAGTIKGEVARARVLTGLVPHLPVELLGKALAVAREIDNEESRAMVLSTLAPHLPEAVLHAAGLLADEWQRAEVLVALAPHLPEAVRQAAGSLAEGGRRAKVLSALAPHLPAEQ